MNGKEHGGQSTPPIKEFKCTYCERIYPTTHMSGHIHHGEQVCKECDNTFEVLDVPEYNDPDDGSWVGR